MEFKNRIGAIVKHVKDLEHIVSQYNSKNEIHVLDVDLLKNKTRELYELILLLEDNKSGIQYENLAGNEVNEEEKVTLNNAKEEDTTIIYDEPVFEKERETEKEKERERQKEKIIEDLKKQEKNKDNQKVKKNQLKEGKETLSDKFKESKKYMNEEISKNHPSNDISSRLKSKPLNDINKAIGLNDKFLFINELFGGDSARYKHTIDMLNNAGNFNDAFEYITENFDWDMDNENVQKILELIRRKHISPV